MYKSCDKLVSEPEFWNEKYISGKTPWDLGGITPVFSHWIRNQVKKLHICVIGAGNGYDAVHFAEQGHNVTAIDFSETAISAVAANAKTNDVDISCFNYNFFDLPSKLDRSFDIVVEYTCFCAVDPEKREELCSNIYRILKPSGRLITLLFPLSFDNVSDKPPFEVSLPSMMPLFSKYFELEKAEIPESSIPPRYKNELFIKMKVKDL